MKKLSLGISAVAMATVLTVPHVQSAGYAENLCAYVQADDKKRLRDYLKSNKLKIRNIFKGIQCGGQNLLSYADTNGSVETGTYLISRLPKKQLSNYIADLKPNTAIAAAAKKRLGG